MISSIFQLMKTPLIFLLILTLAAGGCTTARFPRAAAKARAFDINMTAARGPVTIQLNTRPEPFEAEFFTLMGDSAYWTDRSSGAAMSAPTVALDRISVLDRPGGTLFGMLAGTAAGTGTVLLMEDRSRAADFILGGYAVGGLLGFIFGVKRDFIFE